MKKNVWTVMPIYLIFVLVMLIMAFASFYYNKILFLIEVSISLISFAVVLIFTIDFKKYVRKTVSDAQKSLSAVSSDYIEDIKVPACIVGDNGEILSYNSLFAEYFSVGEDAVNQNIGGFGKKLCIENLAQSDSVIQSQYNDKTFKVYTTKFDKGYFLTFIDNTYYTNLEREFNDTRKSVALVYLDNIEQILSDGDDDAIAAMHTVESLLSRWSGKHNCLYRKLSDRRYMIIFDDKVIKTQIEKKFRILDKIRKITFSDQCMTVSIGIGRNSKTLKDSHNNAKKALDMALGRGGDQVAVLSDGEYEFFGGVAKSVQKTSKVRVRVVAQSMRNALSNCDKVFIMGHRFSDLDCIGSASGIYSCAKKEFGKPAYIVVDEEKSMAKTMIEHLKQREKDMFINVDRALSMFTENSLLVIVDTHSPDFLESAKLYKQSKKLIVIDHHRKMVNFIDNADVFFHEPSASSTSEMITELISYIGDDGLSKVEAEALMGGIMLDTKNFVVNTGVRTFEAAAHLKKKGADTVTVRNMFSNSLQMYKEKFDIVSKSRVVNNCAISSIDGIAKNSRLLSAQAADEMLMIKDVYASFVICNLDSKTVNISARSFGKVNVQVIMEKLGGGGHQNMAAVQLSDTTIEKAKERLLSVIRLS